MKLEFAARTELENREWDNEAKTWERPDINRETLKQLNRRSTLEGAARLIVHTGCLAAAAWLTVFAARYHLLLGVVPYLLFVFLFGFLNGMEHEMRHKIVFSRRLDALSDIFYFIIHVLFKVGTRNQRVSHRTHHRYTMVHGVDPETDFPDVVTSSWVKKTLRGLLFTVLTLGIPSLFKAMWTLFQRTRGRLNPMIQAQCSDADVRFIRLESLAILLINLAATVVFILWQRWDFLLLLILGPQVGGAIVAFWHLTEHIGMMHNADDQRLCTRGVKVSPILKFFYAGLDEHVEHHLFPTVPSRNLAKLREALDWKIAERRSVLQC